MHLLFFFPFLLFNSQTSNGNDSNSILPPTPAPTPTPDPTQLNLTRLLSTRGCSSFAQALATSSTAQKAFNDVVEGGLTVFCPNDDVWSQFSPEFKNLTPPAKTSLLEFHGVPIYMPMTVLKSNNGVTNTLATDGAEKFDFTVQNDGEDVTVKTSVVTAKVDGTGFDEAPLVVFLIDKVLKPDELFRADAPAPAPGSNVGASPPSDSPAESPDESPADQDADGNSAVRVDGGKFYLAVVASSALIGFSLL